jgi:hypothetical protein
MNHDIQQIFTNIAGPPLPKELPTLGANGVRIRALAFPFFPSNLFDARYFFLGKCLY